MSRPLREEVPGAFYHVMSRGNEKQSIYRDTSDKEKFLGYLKLATINYGAVIHSYCLMENHFHLLLETPEGNLSKIMHYINSSYSKYFNAKWVRTGHLFQGRYKSIIVDNDAYLLELSRYIHLNPVKSGYVENPEKYRWSSYLSYLAKTGGEPVWLKCDFLLDMFAASGSQAIERYKEFVEDRNCRDEVVKLWD